jgi:hypothetical protein
MEDNNKLDDFLTDPEAVEEGVSYIQPNIETKLPANKRNECREIVKEIKTFGINQRQLLYLIQLLALEIENREVMQALVKAVGEGREKIQISGLILPEQE